MGASSKLQYNVQARKTARKLAEQELFEYAVQCLGRRAFGADELGAKLRLRAARAVDVETTIARLKDIGYLDDGRFAENFALNRAENDGFGRMRVLSDLRARRVPAKIAEKAVAHVFEDRSETDQIEAFIDRKMPSLRAGGKVEDDRALARAWRRLRHAGFSSSGSLAALKRLAARPELIEEPAEEPEEAES
jgi:regulatory protein